MWTCAMLLASANSHATEYKLSEAATAVTLDGVLQVVPREIDAARVDYTLLVELRNLGSDPLLVRADGWRCFRGADYEGPTGPGVGRMLIIHPRQSQSLTIVCDNGKDARGDFGFVIPLVSRDRARESLEPQALFGNLTWRLAESDIFQARQALGQPLATATVQRLAAPPAPPAP